jgi:hypothetical protein
MSVNHLSWVLRFSQAEHGARLVMLALADTANEEDVSYPSVATLASKTRLSSRAVQEALKRLLGSEEVTLLDGLSEYGTRRYKLPAPPAESDRNVSQTAEGGVQNGAGIVSQTAPDTSVNPAPSVNTPVVPGDVGKVWAHYQATVPNGSRYALNATRRGIIERALKVRDVEACCRAIEGLAGSKHHLEGGYMDIRYALRGKPRDGESDDERIDKMASKATAAASSNGGAPARPAGEKKYVRKGARRPW